MSLNLSVLARWFLDLADMDLGLVTEFDRSSPMDVEGPPRPPQVPPGLPCPPLSVPNSTFDSSSPSECECKHQHRRPAFSLSHSQFNAHSNMTPRLNPPMRQLVWSFIMRHPCREPKVWTYAVWEIESRWDFPHAGGSKSCSGFVAGVDLEKRLQMSRSPSGVPGH
jgi:hypothetical protein